MIKLLLKAKNNGTFERHHVAAMIHKNLNPEYHDKGLGTYRNGMPVKAHTFTFPQTFMEGLNDNDFYINIRGTAKVEKELLNNIEFDEVYRLGNVECVIENVQRINNAALKDKTLLTASPIIMKVTKGHKYYDELTTKTLGEKEYLLPHNKTLWEQEVKYRLIERAKLLGIAPTNEDFNIKLIHWQMKLPQLNIHGKMMKMIGIKGKLEISDPNWSNVAQIIGLGEYTSYGFGVLNGIGGNDYE